VIALVLIAAIGVVDEFAAWISVMVGLVVFLLIAPLCFPRPPAEKA
jgi:hypothetical protein